MSKNLHPIDRMAHQQKRAGVVKAFNLAYMQACCDLGYDAVYVEQYEKGKVKNQMLEKIDALYLEKICKITNKVLEHALFLHRCGTRNIKPDTKRAIELELMTRMM